MIPQIEVPEKADSLALPKALVGGLVWSALALRKRSCARDARWAVRGLRRPLCVLGGEHVPPRGPCLVACNHYNRTGFDAWWVALAISAAIADRREESADPEIHWVMTAAWTFPESAWKRRYLTPVTRWAFARVARVYDFVPMPPMPPDPDEVEARAAAVLRTVRMARQIAPRGGMVGLAPEGRDVEGRFGDLPADNLSVGNLPASNLPAGAGAFIALLVRAGLPVLPVGFGERGRQLCVSFGPLFEPEIPVGRELRDAVVAEQVASAIGLQLVTLVRRR
jgi:1-acyl-sn-glycerol-3-phosphate acyltransferase